MGICELFHLIKCESILENDFLNLTSEQSDLTAYGSGAG